jgi:hypothetical protein
MTSLLLKFWLWKISLGHAIATVKPQAHRYYKKYNYPYLYLFVVFHRLFFSYRLISYELMLWLNYLHLLVTNSN